MAKQFKTSIGGSALIEGIMMRGPEKLACVVRADDELKVREKDLPRVPKFFKIPFVRGVYNFISMMKESYASLSFSAEVIDLEEEAKPGEEPKKEKTEAQKKRENTLIMVVAGILGVGLAVGLFMALPIFLAGLFKNAGIELGRWRAVFEGAVRLVILFLYMLAVSQMKDMKRVFAYHGAEHKTIFCYEAGEELTVENVKKHTRFHPRCGTSFLAMVIVIGIIAFLWVTSDNFLVRTGLKLLMLPFVVSVTYEINRLLGKYDNLLTRIIRAPGLWLQRITTNEPDDDMIEVGIEAMKRVIPAEAGADEWK